MKTLADLKNRIHPGVRLVMTSASNPSRLEGLVGSPFTVVSVFEGSFTYLRDGFCLRHWSYYLNPRCYTFDDDGNGFTITRDPGDKDPVILSYRFIETNSLLEQGEK